MFISINGLPVSDQAMLLTTKVTKDSTQFISTATFTLKNPLNEPEEWQEVLITDVSGNRLFGGFIVGLLRRAPPYSPIYYDVKCSDYGALCDRMSCPDDFTAYPDQQIMVTLGTAVPGITVTLGNIASIATIPFLAVKDQTIRQAFSSVCALTGGEWRVDAYRNLLYYKSGSIVAPWGITPGGQVKACIDGVQRDFSTAANQVTVLGWNNTTGAQVSATANDTASQAKYGTLTAVVVDRSISDADTALLRAQAEIATRAWPIISGVFRTYADGLDVGQTMHIKSPAYLLDGDYLARTISTRQLHNDVDPENKQTEYTVTFGQRIPDLVLRLLRMETTPKQSPTPPPVGPPSGPGGGGSDHVPDWCHVVTVSYTQLIGEMVGGAQSLVNLWHVPSKNRLVATVSNITSPFGKTGDTLNRAVHSGGGLDDASFSCSGIPGTGYIVVIDGTGTLDSFAWGVLAPDGSSYIMKASHVGMSGGVPVVLQDGVSVTFAAGAGHTLGDSWVATNPSSPSFQFGAVGWVDNWGTPVPLVGTPNDCAISVDGFDVGLLASAPLEESLGDGEATSLNQGSMKVWIYYQPLPDTSVEPS